MYHVSAQCVDERMINVHYYYYGYFYYYFDHSPSLFIKHRVGRQGLTTAFQNGRYQIGLLSYRHQLLSELFF